MVGSSKILTVSYGTFSCTLEGFEDSFGTMKAIAEYFRDLAADDRYFGAEPPIPDADMLARIAEREVARRVEARMDASGIVLRVGQAMDNQPVAAPVTDHPVVTSAPAVVDPPVIAPQPLAPQSLPPLMPPAPTAPVLNVPRPVAPVQIAPVVTAPIQPAAEIKRVAPIYPDGDSVAAKLQRIRAVVGKGSTSLLPMDFASDNDDAAPIIADVTEPDPVEIPAIAALCADPVDEVTAILDEVSADLDPDAALVPAVDPEPVAEIEPELAVDDAPELVKSEGLDLDAAETREFGPSEPEPSQPDAIVAVPATPAPIRARVIKMRRADFDRAVAAGMLVEDPTNAARPGTDLPATTSLVGDLPELDDLSLDDISDQLAADGLADDLQTDEAADLDDLARLDGLSDLPATGAALSDDDEADLLAELEAVERETATAQETVSADPEIEAVTNPADNDATDADVDLAMMQMLARVTDTTVGPKAEPQTDDTDISDLSDAIRAARDDAAADQVADEDAENLFADDALAEPDGSGADNSFDAFDENEEVEMAAEDSIGDEDAIKAEGDDLDPHSHLRTEPEADEAGLSRIMSEAEAQLSEPEASRRREAIAQLRAAVAATEAARRLGERPTATDTNADESAFRDDLQQVVRPRRPMTPTAEVRSERPRPAPLKLVASQRVDLPQTAARGAVTMPIRPRRVTIAPDAPTAPAVSAVPFTPAPARPPAAAGAGSFADFAADMGATSLSDLLEAAAAYTAFVEGSEDFSRPQLLRKVTQMAPETYSREDGLRSFGTLLREGRIMRTRAGRFQVNEETRFNPERRAG